VGLATKEALAAAFVIYGGWALLAWLGAVAPVELGYWWLVPVAYGLYMAAKALLIDIRERGELSEFFAFWGPYRTSALLRGILGIIVAIAVIQFTRLRSEPEGVQAFILIGLPSCMAFVGISEAANKRREFPLLAAWDIAANGFLLGLILGFGFYLLQLRLRQDQYSREALGYWCASFAVAGALGNLWRRFGLSSGVRTASGLADMAVQTKVMLQGLWFAALGALLIWVTWKTPLEQYLPDNARILVLFAGTGIGAYLLLARGLGPIVNVLGGSRLGGNTHGAARTATQKELRAAKLGPHKNGIYLGNFHDPVRPKQVGDRIEYPGDVHLVTVGRTGSGKGTGLIIPNLSTLRRSVLIVDPKGEAAAITARKRATFGRVVMLNPFNVLADKCPWLTSEGFNPLATVRMDRDNFLDDCTIIAQSLVKQERGGNGRFFSGSAHDLVTALVMHELLNRRKNATLANVRHLLTEEFGVDQAGNAIGLARTIIDMTLSDFEPLRAKATRFKQDTRSNKDVILTAINETSFIDSPPVARDLASRSDFRFDDMKNEIVTVYLVLPATHLESHSNWLRLIIASALRELLATPPSTALPSVLFMLDEFAQLDHLPAISNAMNIARGYGVQLWPFVQDLTQLKDIYEDRWENFLSASAALTAFAPRDVFTSEYLSRLSGNKTIIVESENQRSGDGGIGRSRGPQGAPLLRPEELRAMPSAQMLCFVEPVKAPFLASAPGYWTTSFKNGLDPNPYRPA